MTDRRKAIGRRGEAIARVRLREMGYRILEANYRSRYGEIDLVARHSDEYVFVEVRSKSAKSAGQPEESITSRKRDHLIATAQEYLQSQVRRQRRHRPIRRPPKQRGALEATMSAKIRTTGHGKSVNKLTKTQRPICRARLALILVRGAAA